jgi:hypothetical protein
MTLTCSKNSKFVGLSPGQLPVSVSLQVPVSLYQARANILAAGKMPSAGQLQSIQAPLSPWVLLWSQSVLCMKYASTSPLPLPSLQFTISLIFIVQLYKIAPNMLLIHKCSLNIRDIINPRLRGEREHSYPHFVYKTLCYQSRTHGLKRAGHLGSEFKWQVLATISHSATEFRPTRIERHMSCHCMNNVP